jgi:hypothetical protein
LLHDETLVADGTFDVSSISGDYDELRIVLTGRSAVGATADWARLRLNNDSGNNYDHRLLHEVAQTSSATDAAIGVSSVQWTVELPGTSSTAGWVGSLELWIPEYAGTTFRKIGHWIGGSRFSTNEIRSHSGSFMWNNTAAVDRIQLYSAGGDFLTGTRLRIYGVGGGGGGVSEPDDETTVLGITEANV